MRTTLLALATTAALLLGAGAAQALSITPDPVSVTADNGFNADVHLVSIGGDTLAVQVEVNVGTLLALDVPLLLEGGGGPGFLLPSSVSVLGGTGDVGVSSSVVVGSEAQFDFAGGGVGAGQTSDVLEVTFAGPIPVGWAGNLSFDPLNDTFETVGFTIVPEPALGLLALGGGLLALAARRGWS